MRPASDLVFGLGAGAFRLLPVAALYLARPLAVRPAPLETGSFSPRPTAREGFFAMVLIVKDKKYLAAYLKCTSIYATGAIYHTFPNIAGIRVERRFEEVCGYPVKEIRPGIR